MVGRRTEWGESAWNPESQYEKMNLVQERPSSLSRVEHAVECEADLPIVFSEVLYIKI